MSRILALVLCIALLAQHLARFSVAVVYELRRDFVARNLCENRDRPELSCCGKCVLKKQLAKADDGAGNPGRVPGKAAEPEVAVLPDLRGLEPIPPSSGEILKPFNPGHQRMHHSDPPTGIFRPPLL